MYLAIFFGLWKLGGSKLVHGGFSGALYVIVFRQGK